MKYVFLSYINRSGSTFLMNQLGQFECFCITPESDLLFELLNKKSIKTGRKIIELLYEEEKFKTWNISQKELIQIKNKAISNSDKFFGILNLYKEKVAPKSDTIVYKHNNLFKFTGKFNTMGRAIFHLCLVRDPRDIYLSQKFTISPFTHAPMSNNPVVVARQWRYYSKTILKVKDNICIFRFEDLMNSSESVIKEILDFTKLQSQTKKEFKIESVLNKEYRLIHKHSNRMPDQTKVNSWEDELNVNEKTSIDLLCSKSYMLWQYKINKHNISVKTLVYFLHKLILSLISSFRRKLQKLRSKIYV